MYKNYIKPIIDFTLSLLGLLILSPLFLILWIMLTVANKGAGAFFTQARPGRNEKIFKVIKFKTMTDERDSAGEHLPDEERLTKTGKLVRSTSLDEIPQLFNVLKGEMSLVGPRPLFVQYLPLYNDTQRKRHNVRPGITGWAQVNGRNSIAWKEKFELDVWYVNNITATLDFKIVLMTIQKIFKREGISQEGHVTVEEFRGNY